MAACRTTPARLFGILTVEGVAPYITQNAFTRAHQARRYLEVTMGANLHKVCEAGGQEGVDATGSNYNPCTPISRDDAARTLSGAFGDTDNPNAVGDAGTLEAME